MNEGSSGIAPDRYCRDIEAYLCRKNDGHIIRIVGPAFEQVSGWAARGVPLTVACRGIDRYFERYYAKGRRRRPVRIEFCEADVLDVFDEWRRAVGITAVNTGEAAESADEESARRVGSLPAHLERVVARLTALRAGEDRSLDAVADALIRELDTVRAGARQLRGESRQNLLDRLRQMDRELLDAARAQMTEGALQDLAGAAARELEPFRERLAPDAYDRSIRASIDRLIRERRRLPVITYE
ncbi:MAG TPA: hypothetical protein VGF24_23610 [Vicinamibacterales bacterium]